MHDQHESKRKIPPPPQSSSFLTTFLGVIHYLQGIECFHNGVPSGAIESYMCKNYPVDGDIKSQITCAINQALRFGFIQQRNNCRYSLINAVAGIYLSREEVEKQQELCHARHLFQSIWKNCSEPPNECVTNRCMSPPGRKRNRSKSSCESNCGSKRNRCSSRQKKTRKKRCARTKKCEKRTKKNRTHCGSSSCKMQRKSTRASKCPYERIRGKRGVCDCSCEKSFQRF